MEDYQALELGIRKYVPEGRNEVPVYEALSVPGVAFSLGGQGLYLGSFGSLGGGNIRSCTGIDPDDQREIYPLSYPAESVIGAANFAGHYRLEVNGCGTMCYGGKVVDLFTGEAIPLPAASLGYRFQATSRHLVTDSYGWLEPEQEEDVRQLIGEPKHYVLEEGRGFVEL
jgi:hypothetical protein